MTVAADDGGSGRLTAAAKHSLSDAGHELAANVVVAPAVQDRVDASRASQRQHLESQVEQAEDLGTGGGVYSDDSDLVVTKMKSTC